MRYFLSAALGVACAALGFSVTTLDGAVVTVCALVVFNFFYELIED